MNYEKRVVRYSVTGFIVISSMIVLGVTLNRSLESTWNDMSTKSTQHSYTYVQTKKELLIRLIQDYRKLETQQSLHKDEMDVVSLLESQKKATLDRIKMESSTLSKDELPVEVEVFLR